jgi:hypothetical protein
MKSAVAFQAHTAQTGKRLSTSLAGWHKTHRLNQGVLRRIKGGGNGL